MLLAAAEWFTPGSPSEPEELQGAVVWLCSDATSFVTGAVILVDAGFNSFSGL